MALLEGRKMRIGVLPGRGDSSCHNGIRHSFVFLSMILLSLPLVFSHVHKDFPLLIVSFDGFRWDYLNRTKTPNFNRVIHDGVYARKGLKNVFVTDTLPNHWSMVTGLYSESHGIVGNEMYDPILKESFVPLYRDRFVRNDPHFYDVPGVQPIWALNQQQKHNGRTGSIMWWGAENIVHASRPTYHVPYDLSFDDFKKIDIMMNWFTDEYPINLGLLYFPQPDKMAHKCGVESDNVTREIARSDELVGYLLKNLEEHDLLDDVNLIITSDHGFVSTSKDKLILLDKIVDPTWYKAVHYTPVLCIIPHEGYMKQIYDKLKSAGPSHHFQVFYKDELPEDYHLKHNVRVTPITAIADLSYNFLINMSVDNFTLAGTHGYSNTYQEMRPFFMAMGPSFKSKFTVDSFNLIDIYALMCHLLHLSPGPNNSSLSLVSQLLKEEHETTVWTFSTYIICLIIIASVGGVYVVAACRQHRYLKRKLNQLRLSTIGPSKSNLISTNGAKVRLLSDDEDGDDDEF